MVLTLAMSQVNDFSFLLFLFGAPRVCLSDNDKCYKNTTRIRILWPFWTYAKMTNFQVSDLYGSILLLGRHKNDLKKKNYCNMRRLSP